MCRHEPYSGVVIQAGKGAKRQNGPSGMFEAMARGSRIAYARAQQVLLFDPATGKVADVKGHLGKVWSIKYYSYKE